MMITQSKCHNIKIEVSSDLNEVMEVLKRSPIFLAILGEILLTSQDNSGDFHLDQEGSTNDHETISPKELEFNDEEWGKQVNEWLEDPHEHVSQLNEQSKESLDDLEKDSHHENSIIQELSSTK